MTTLIHRFFLVTATACLVAACGGGGGGGPNGGIDRLGVSAGTVDAFGSIFVNGVEFDTDRADFDVDDDAIGSSEDDLNVGDFVVVLYDLDDPFEAVLVISDEIVEGPVDSVTPDTDRLVVAGQTVLVDASTSFDDSEGVTSLMDIEEDDYVEVSGYIDGDGNIRATRIEKKSGPGEIEIHGIVMGKDADTFMINDLTINYTAIPAEIDDDFPGGTFENGDFVQVEGDSFAGDTLLATEIEPDGFGYGEDGEDNIDDDDIDELELEGYITRFVSPTDFDVNGFPVTTNGGTEYEDGDAGDLALNVKVEVEGDVNAFGVLVADEIEFEEDNELEVAGLVDSVDLLADSLTVLGVVIRIDAQTRLEDKSDAELEPFALDDIFAGDYVKVKGSVGSGAGDVDATLLEREDMPDVPGEETELTGFVEAIARPFITILGVTIDTTGADFDDGDADDFFDNVMVGDLVEVEGTETGDTSMDAEEVELEDD